MSRAQQGAAEAAGPTGDVVEAPEDQLHVVPHPHGAEARVRLSEGGELVALELVRFHGDGAEREGLVDGEVCGEDRAGEAWRSSRRSEFRGQTCGDAVEVSSGQIADPPPLELEGGGAINGGNGGVAPPHPVHQPLDLTVAVEDVPPQVPEETATESLEPPPEPPPGPAPAPPTTASLGPNTLTAL